MSACAEGYVLQVGMVWFALARCVPACSWCFLELLFPQMSVGVCACVHPPLKLLINSGVMWCDLDPI